MCLITKQQVPLQAVNDIQVFKVLEKGNDVLWSPYYGSHIYEFNKEYQTTLSECITREVRFHGDLDTYIIQKEFGRMPNTPKEKYNWLKANKLKAIGQGFHSFSSLEACIVAFENMQDLQFHSFVVVSCIVPVTSFYYRGYADLFVSDRIIINKIIK